MRRTTPSGRSARRSTGWSPARCRAGARSGRRNEFEGFHRIELDLWRGQDLGAAAADAGQLAGNVATLVEQFSIEAISPAELPLRTHEILEDSMRTSSAATTITAAAPTLPPCRPTSREEVLLHLLAPLLKNRAPDLVPRAMVQLNRLDVALAGTMQGGHWVAVGLVPLTEREQVDGAIGAALEILAVIPDVMPVVGSPL